MQTVENERMTNGVVSLDGKAFRNCHYSDCEVIYGGGETEWGADSSFRNCRLTLVDAASRTVNFLQLWNFRILAPSGAEFGLSGSMLQKGGEKQTN